MTAGARTPGPSVRRARVADAPAMVRIIEAAYRGTGGWTTESHLLGGTRTSLATVEAMIADPASVLLVAEAREDPARILGCCNVHPPEEGGELTEFGLFAVDPAEQSAGVGRLLLDAAEDVVRGRGEDMLEIRVLQSRPELRAWYLRRGFVPTGEVRPYPGDASHLKVAGLGMEVMVKRLAPGD